jgi:putative oxidoreductase
MRGIWGLDPGWGVTVVRLVMGVIVVLAGCSALRAGMDKVSASFAAMGMPMPEISGPFIVILELVGGVLLLLGIFGRWLGLLFAVQFLVAAVFVNLPGGGFNDARLDLMLLAGGLLLLLTGPGRAAIDQLWLEKP